MIYITGDIHGHKDIQKLTPEQFPRQKELTHQDYLIICGDFGNVWNGSDIEKYWLNWINNRNFTTLFVDGNHENYDLLKEYKVIRFHGGKAQQIKANIYHLMRGQVYDLDGYTIFTMGGASSHDISGGILDPYDRNFEKKANRLELLEIPYRVNHYSWWKEELPSAEEYAEAERNLNRVDRKVDYIISHCAPNSIQNEIASWYTSDALTAYLESVKNTVQYDRWFCGHYHIDDNLDDKHVFLFNAIVRIDL